MKELKNIGSVIHYNFVDKDKLKAALTHPNVVAFDKETNKPLNYERLEFLGDCVLEMIVSDLVYKRFPDENGGELTRKRQGLTCSRALVRVANKLNLSRFIIINKVISVCNDSCLEDVMEALIGAVYLDGGFEKAKSFVHDHWKEIIESDSYHIRDENIKSEIETWTHHNNYPVPQYKVIREEGPVHQKLYTVKLKIKSFKSVTASASSIKNAEKKAAKLLLNIIQREVPETLQGKVQDKGSSNDHVSEESKDIVEQT